MDGNMGSFHSSLHQVVSKVLPNNVPPLAISSSQAPLTSHTDCWEFARFLVVRKKTQNNTDVLHLFHTLLVFGEANLKDDGCFTGSFYEQQAALVANCWVDIGYLAW